MGAFCLMTTFLQFDNPVVDLMFDQRFWWQLCIYDFSNGKFIKMVRRGMQLAHNKTLRRVEGPQIDLFSFHV